VSERISGPLLGSPRTIGPGTLKKPPSSMAPQHLSPGPPLRLNHSRSNGDEFHQGKCRIGTSTGKESPSARFKARPVRWHPPRLEKAPPRPPPYFFCFCSALISPPLTKRPRSPLFSPRKFPPEPARPPLLAPPLKRQPKEGHFGFFRPVRNFSATNELDPRKSLYPLPETIAYSFSAINQALSNRNCPPEIGVERPARRKAPRD